MSPQQPTAQQQIDAVKGELQGIISQIPIYTEMAARLKRAQEDLSDPEMDNSTALKSAVGALVFCQTEQFETGIKNMAARGDMLEKALKHLEERGGLVAPAAMIPGKRFGR